MNGGCVDARDCADSAGFPCAANPLEIVNLPVCFMVPDVTRPLPVNLIGALAAIKLAITQELFT